MGRAEARRLTEEVMSDAAALWRKLHQLYEGKAHLALGYSSWQDYCAEEFDLGKSQAYRMLDAGRVVAAIETHSPIGERDGRLRPPRVAPGTPATEGVARELVPILREDEQQVVEVWRELRAKHGERVTAAKVRDAVTGRLAVDAKLGTLNSSHSIEWYTPAKYVDAARSVLGAIDIDPASCAQANRVVRAAAFYDAAADGLKRPWTGRVWLNPPYGDICRYFVSRLLSRYETGDVTAAIVLLNANTDVDWFRGLWAHPLCFTDHRISFESPAGDPGGGNPRGSVFAYMGPQPALFAATFRQFGAVVRLWDQGQAA